MNPSLCSVSRLGHFLFVLVILSHAVVSRAAQSPPANENILEEIVVEATRVETNLQETPMSVHVLSEAFLENANIDAGRDLGIMVPNVVFSPSTMGERDSVLTMRGLPGVTTYLDGIWTGSYGILQRQFVEMERVEILRGPQGTHFGRNANGGAIQLITKKPGNELRFKSSLELGRFDTRTANFSVDIPVSDTLLTKWTVGHTESGGFMKSRSADLTLGNFDNSLFRGDVLWQVTEDLSIRFIASGVDNESTDARIVRINDPQNPIPLAYNILAGNPDLLAQARAIDPAFPDPPFALATDRFTPESHQAGYPGGSLGKWETRSNALHQGATNKTLGGYLDIHWQLNPHHSLISKSRYTDSELSLGWEEDASELDLHAGVGFDNPSVFSQELHWVGNWLDGKLESLLGFYYQKYSNWARVYRWYDWDFVQSGPNPGQIQPNFTTINYVRDWGQLVGNPVMTGFFPGRALFQSADFISRNNAKERALFGELKYFPLDEIEITLGLRITEDDKGKGAGYAPAEAIRSNTPGEIPPGDKNAVAALLGERKLPDLGNVKSPRVSIAWRPGEDIYLYASYAEGFTQGEIIPYQELPEPIILDPEVARTWELGLRSELLRHRLRMNATIFRTRWKGLRVPKLLDIPGAPPTTLQVRTSDGNAETSGIEIDLSYLPNEHWVLDLAVGYLDSKYTDIGDPPANGTGLQPGISLPYAPELSYSIGVGYFHPLPGGELSFFGNYGWMDKYERAASFDLQSRNSDGSPKPEPSYGILNTRLVYQPDNQPWQVFLFGKNLTNEWYVNGGDDPSRYIGYDLATIGRPREYGVGFQYNWTR